MTGLRWEHRGQTLEKQSWKKLPTKSRQGTLKEEEQVMGKRGTHSIRDTCSHRSQGRQMQLHELRTAEFQEPHWNRPGCVTEQPWEGSVSYPTRTRKAHLAIRIKHVIWLLYRLIVTEQPTPFLMLECAYKPPGSLPKMRTARPSPEIQNPQL